MTKGELERCGQIREKDTALRLFLHTHGLADPPDAHLWFRYLTGVRQVLGNLSNDLGFLATLLSQGISGQPLQPRIIRRFGEGPRSNRSGYPG